MNTTLSHAAIQRAAEFNNFIPVGTAVNYKWGDCETMITHTTGIAFEYFGVPHVYVEGIFFAVPLSTIRIAI